MVWTDEQREAIEYSGENILLAAAAGSGKTAVLVQRIIELISRKTDPVNINELLVLTFTDAAAREMREKILDAIGKALAQNPEDEHLKKQRLLIHSANISTIHSFCLQLLKNNIHMTDLPVNFSLISETENKMLLSATLDGVLERFYGKIDKDPSIAGLVMGYGGIKNDMGLRETVLSLLNFSKSMAFPVKWLNEAVREFKKIQQSGLIDGSVWQKWLRARTEQSHYEVIDIYRDIKNEISLRLGDDHPYMAFFDEEEANVKRTFEHMNMDSYSSVREELSHLEFARLTGGTRKAEGEVAAAQGKVKALRQLATEQIKDLKTLYRIPQEDAIERIKNTYPVLRTLKNIVLICNRSYTKKKREKNFLDFSDLEHEALGLLVDKCGNKTAVAQGLSKHYREILIDEYQDTNHIQDTIFRAVSKENNNIFMVGDLKQSIYTFRNAVPKLFSDKYYDYDEDGGAGHLIRLFKNFRSRDEVVDSVNFIFKTVMGLEVGDVDYTDEEYLIRGAQYPENPDKDMLLPEFHIACSNSEAQEGEDSLSKYEIEGNIAAKRIREMIESKMEVFDKTIQMNRPVEYRDIVVLMRNTKAAAPVFEEIFESSHIPVYTEVGKSYLNSREVQTVLSILQIIDNPRQDIPLIAVMRSPIWGFSPEELAEMRADMKTGCFFDALKYSAEMKNLKAESFLKDLDNLRKMSESVGVEQLVWRIYYDYGYYAYSGTQNRGRERQANLRLLFERAAEFEHTGLSGLFSFMVYIESIRSQGDDLTPSKTFGDGDNVVRIMTVHKSKGLEFPVVILADTAHEFNVTDLNKNIIWNTEMGIGADYVDKKLRVRYPSLPRDIVAAKAKGELVSEEMRLLYVALTRAREKLIITTTFKKTKTGMSMPLYAPDGRAKPAYVRGKRCFRDWIMAALFVHPDGETLREYFGFQGSIKVCPSNFKINTFIYDNQSEVPRAAEILMQTANDEVQINDVGFDDDIRARLEYEYPNEYLAGMPVKLSISEVKRMQAEEADYVPMLRELKMESLEPLKKVSGAEKGTAVHFVMQMVDPHKLETVADVQKLIDELRAGKAITDGQAQAIEPQKIFNFFSSEMGKRLKNANRLEREFSFYTKADISEVYGCDKPGEILLQGTMDCFFEDNDGKVVLLDFKTDRAKNKAAATEISRKYTVQMKYYKKALAEILKRQVDECYLYFLDCGELVEM